MHRRLPFIAAVVAVAALAAGCKSAAKDYVDRSKAIEAEISLKNIEKTLQRSYAEEGSFPTGTAGFAPAAACCAGPDKQCAPDAASWTGPIWAQLDIEPRNPHRFQLSYQSADGQTATAIARGDLDCDGTTIDYTLTCTSPGGVPRCELVKPAKLD